MKHLYILLLASLLIYPSCTSGQQKESTITSQPESSNIASAPEEAVKDTVIPFEIKEFKAEKGDNKLEVEYPISGNPILLASVRTWINELLGGTYRGNPDDADAFFRHYSLQLGTDPELNEYGGYTIDIFKKAYENDLVLTYDYTTYVYEGGAHGMGGVYGTTFLRSDGSIFDRQCFKSYKPLHSLFIEGLKQYFKVKTDEELAECLSNPSSLTKLSDPGMKPWITGDGVMFSYTPYEIAPYSAGSPRFAIPFEKLRPYLTEKGLQFFISDEE